MKEVAVISMALVIAADGALNLKVFRDPKEEHVKIRQKPCSIKTLATRCQPPEITLLAEQGFLQSQDGIDQCVIEHYFPGVCRGFYLDLGAHDGIQASNTYALYQVLGWKGINIEINPDSYEELAENRKGDAANIKAAVCAESRLVHFAVGENKAKGGIWELSSDAHREGWWPGITLYNTIPLMCTPLQTILDKIGAGKSHFDFATIDLEGGELPALLGIDFERVSFGVIVVEKNENEGINVRIEDLLHSKGYAARHAEKKCSNRNIWFFHADFQRIYERLH